MKKLCLSSVVMLAMAIAMVSASAQQVSKQRYSVPAASADAYDLTLHVTHSRLAPVMVPGALPSNDLQLTGVLQQMNVELEGGPGYGLLPPGDYKVRLLGEDRKKDGSIARQYDLLLANGQHEVFNLVGLSE